MWAMGFFGKSAKTQILKSEILKNKAKRKNALRIYKTLDRSGEKKTDRRIVYIYITFFSAFQILIRSQVSRFFRLFLLSGVTLCVFLLFLSGTLYHHRGCADKTSCVHTPVSPLCSLSSYRIISMAEDGPGREISNFPSRKNIEK